MAPAARGCWPLRRKDRAFPNFQGVTGKFFEAREQKDFDAPHPFCGEVIDSMRATSDLTVIVRLACGAEVVAGVPGVRFRNSFRGPYGFCGEVVDLIG
jgi:hypothetical protein